ncbi:biotin transporter BioY [Archangium violaceum]|uniref:biotin transporter BioY n=1 Tax=Archangium violaceum TaxID=83451 RepID=UPI00193BF2AE|nr:biotin transporter BioY [Archangium violaceum]QRK10512.1 biotin transporter BioY [Archangium violaceum]
MKTRDLVHVALFAAILAVLGVMPPIALPFIPVPISVQTLGVMLAGSSLGARKAGLSMLLFHVLVAAGLPLLAGGRGGLAVYAGPTGGFFVGFLPGAFLVGWLTERAWTRLSVPLAFAINLLGGAFVLYALGIPWLAVAAKLPLAKAALGSLAFLPGDCVKAAIAASTAVTLKRAWPLIQAPRPAAPTSPPPSSTRAASPGPASPRQ